MDIEKLKYGNNYYPFYKKQKPIILLYDNNDLSSALITQSGFEPYYYEDEINGGNIILADNPYRENISIFYPLIYNLKKKDPTTNSDVWLKSFNDTAINLTSQYPKFYIDTNNDTAYLFFFNIGEGTYLKIITSVQGGEAGTYLINQYSYNQGISQIIELTDSECYQASFHLITDTVNASEIVYCVTLSTQNQTLELTNSFSNIDTLLSFINNILEPAQGSFSIGTANEYHNISRTLSYPSRNMSSTATRTFYESIGWCLKIPNWNVKSINFENPYDYFLHITSNYQKIKFMNFNCLRTNISIDRQILPNDTLFINDCIINQNLIGNNLIRKNNKIYHYNNQNQLVQLNQEDEQNYIYFTQDEIDSIFNPS